MEEVNCEVIQVYADLGRQKQSASQDFNNPAIGEDLFISLDGVRYHIRHIYEKLQVNSRGEAVAKGYESRLIHPSRK